MTGKKKCKACYSSSPGCVTNHSQLNGIKWYNHFIMFSGLVGQNLDCAQWKWLVAASPCLGPELGTLELPWAGIIQKVSSLTCLHLDWSDLKAGLTQLGLLSGAFSHGLSMSLGFL